MRLDAIGDVEPSGSWCGVVAPPDEEYHVAARSARSTFGADVGPMRQHWSPEFDLSSTFGEAIARRHGRVTALAPRTPLAASLDAAITGRTSRRDLAGRPVRAGELATILWATYGQLPADAARRTVPSGGGLYPLDVYASCRDVDGLTAGLYQFDPFDDVLIGCEAVTPRRGRSAGIGDTFVHGDVTAGAAVIVMFVGVFARNRSKYGQRALRYTLIEAGHAAQNALLACAVLGLAACPLGGFFDNELDHLIGLDGVHESAIYAVAIGSGDGSGKC